jgi:hypothetical protein
MVIAVVAAMPLLPVVCDALCATPETTQSTCHDPQPADASAISAAGCATEVFASPDTILDPPFRLQQRSLSTFWLDARLESAAAALFPAHGVVADNCSPPRSAVLRI